MSRERTASRRPRARLALPLIVFAAAIPTTGFALRKALARVSPRTVAERYRDAQRAAASLEPAPPAFRDATRELGLEFTHDNGARGEFLFPEEMGGGAGLFDLERDGDLDLFVAGGGEIARGGKLQNCRLFRNDGGRFVDATTECNAGVSGPAYGVACADCDGDGDVDVFVTRLGTNVLLVNDGRGRFSDGTRAAGLAGGGFGASSVFFDYDRDGRLDLYGCNYIDWSEALETPCHAVSGARDYCSPTSYRAPAQDRLYHNLGGGRFEDVTVRAGIDGHRGQALGVVARDFDGDGWRDVYVANDSTRARLWINRGDGTFSDQALQRGCAYNSLGVAIAGMGVAAEDLDGDGRDDLFVTNIGGQSHLVLINEGASFRDRSVAYGLGDWSVRPTGFGVALFDQDLDGAWDGYVSNGAVDLTQSMAADRYQQPDQFVRLRGGRFADHSSEGGELCGETGRAVAVGDLDGDGDLDLVVTNNGGRLHALLDRYQGPNAWLLVDARDENGAPAIGARITVVAGGKRQVREISAQHGYLASHDPRAHFGLGPVATVDELTVEWADGERSVRRDVAVRRVLVLDRNSEPTAGSR